jgi:hypothetical protein
MVVCLALALHQHQQCLVHGEIFEQVKVFKYPGLDRLLAQQDNNNVQAVHHAQLHKARRTWTWFGNVLSVEDVALRVMRCSIRS